jgi:uncharacterized protein involved in exopolysaccharide biosynthesis
MDNKDNINQYYQDGEINFGELFNEIKKNLISIILITSTFAIFSVFYSLSLPNIYSSQSILKIADESASNSFSSMASDFSGLATLAGINLPSGGGDESDYAIELLKSKEFVKHISNFDGVKENIMAIKEYDQKTKSIVYDNNIYDAKNKEWIRNPPAGRFKVPSYLELHEEISKVMNISKDRKTGFIKISFEHQSPYFAYDFLDLVIRELNQITKKINMDASQSSLDYLYSELPKINERDVRDSMNNLIESQLKIQMLANVRSDYMLKTIDAPYIPEIKSKPSRSIICIIGTLVGFILSMIFVLIRYFIYKD